MPGVWPKKKKAKNYFIQRFLHFLVYRAKIAQQFFTTLSNQEKYLVVKQLGTNNLVSTHVLPTQKQFEKKKKCMSIEKKKSFYLILYDHSYLLMECACILGIAKLRFGIRSYITTCTCWSKITFTGCLLSITTITKSPAFQKCDVI